MINWRLHITALALVVIAELIGIKSFSLGPREKWFFVPHALCPDPGDFDHPPLL